LAVFALMIYYNLKIKGVGGSIHELFCAHSEHIQLCGLPILA